MVNLAKIGLIEEQRLVHQQSQEFTMRSRHLKQLALWAAAQMGRSGERAERYVDRILGIGVSGVGDAPVVNAIARDFAAQGLACDKQAIWNTLSRIKAMVAVPSGRASESGRLAASGTAGTAHGNRPSMPAGVAGGPAQSSSQRGPPGSRGRG